MGDSRERSQKNSSAAHPLKETNWGHATIHSTSEGCLTRKHIESRFSKEDIRLLLQHALDESVQLVCMQAADDSERLLFAQAKTRRKDLECPNLEGQVSFSFSVIQQLCLDQCQPYPSSGQTWAETLDRATSYGPGMGDP